MTASTSPRFGSLAFAFGSGAARSGLLAVLCGALAAASASAAAPPSAIRLLMDNPSSFARAAEPVTCGVPLSRGFAEEASQLALRTAQGRAVPVQVETTSRFVDGSPRWVLLHFLADLPAGGRAVYELGKGSRAAAAQPLRYRLTGGVAEMDTGAAQFRVDTRRFRLFDSVRVGGRELVASGDDARGVILQAPDGRRLARWTTTQAVFEDAGPLTATLCVRARASDGTWPARIVCRLRFYAGKSEVRVWLTLHNPAAHRHPGNVWDLGSGGSLMLEDCSLLLPLAVTDAHSQVGAEPGAPPIDADLLYQDSSGGVHWDSANHIDRDYKVRTTFRGYRALRGGRRAAEGLRADGWIHVRGRDGVGAAAAVREFWQNFPKGLQWDGRRIRVGLWPAEFAGEHEILGGEQKTHELLFVFHDAAADERAVVRRMEAFHQPLYVLPEAAAVLATRAFWPTGPLDRRRFGALERTCDAFVQPVGSRPASVITKWEQIDEFGWRHFGDTFADNEFAPAEMVRDFPEHHFGRQPISHYGNEYDVAYAVWLQGLRREDPKWMWLADMLCRHYADICIYHTDEDGSAAYRHGPFTHTTHDTAAYRSTHRMYPIEAVRYGLRYNSGGPNAGHCYVASLAQHYYLTGNRTSREAMLEVAGWSVNSPWFTRMMMGDRRGIGNLLMTHVDAWQMTADRKYYDAAMRMIRYVQEPFEGLGATLFAKAAGRFLDMKLENGQLDEDYRAAQAKLLMFGDHYLTLPNEKPHESLEQTCFYTELLSLCWLHAPPDHPNRERYFRKAAQLMAAAQPRWPAAYRPTKTLVMCFANTGAWFRALAERQRPGPW